jgi:hypothetical protein
MRILKSILSKTNAYDYSNRRGKYQFEHYNSDLFRLGEIISIADSELDGIKVSKLIRPNGINFQTSADAIRKLAGKPSAYFYHPGNPDFISLLYITNFLSYDVQSYFHFYKESLFLAENQFFVMSKEDNECLLSILNGKFGTKLENLKSPNLLLDGNGNKLLAQQDVYINLFYIAAGTDLIKEQIEKNSPERIRQQIRKLEISKWIEKI